MTRPSIDALPLATLAQGVRVGDEFQVNTFTPNAQTLPSVAVETDGDFVVAFEGNLVSGSDVFASR